jgi:PKD domain-containing protein
MQSIKTYIVSLCAAWIVATGCESDQGTDPIDPVSLVVTYRQLDLADPLTVTFDPVVSPSYKTHWKYHWQFGDGSPAVSMSDALSFTHTFPDRAVFSVTVEVIDTVKQAILAKKIVMVDLLPQQIDTNDLHTYKKIRIVLTGSGEYMGLGLQQKPIDTLSLQDFLVTVEDIRWDGFHFYAQDTESWYNRSGHFNEYYDRGSQSVQVSGGFDSTCSLTFGSMLYYFFRDWTDPTYSEMRQVFREMTYTPVPFVRSGSDTLTFSSHGEALRLLITSVKDSTEISQRGRRWLNQLMIEAEAPILTIQLFK